MPAAPKPPMTIKQRKALKSKPHRIPERIRLDTFARWGTSCLWCREFGGAVDLHHVTRRSQGGADSPDNLRPVHRKCHSHIHDNPAEAKRRGFLA